MPLAAERISNRIDVRQEIDLGRRQQADDPQPDDHYQQAQRDGGEDLPPLGHPGQQAVAGPFCTSRRFCSLGCRFGQRVGRQRWRPRVRRFRRGLRSTVPGQRIIALLSADARGFPVRCEGRRAGSLREVAHQTCHPEPVQRHGFCRPLQQSGQIVILGQEKQGFRHVAGTLEAVRGRLGQHLQQDRSQRLRDVGAQTADIRHRLAAMRFHQIGSLHVARRRKRRLPHQQAVQRAAQAVDIRPDVRRSLPVLFGGHECKGSGDACIRDLRIAQSGVAQQRRQTEIGHFDLGLAIGQTAQQDILGLDVAVYQPVFMGMFEPHGGRPRDFAGVAHR